MKSNMDGMKLARIAVDAVEERAKSCTAAVYGLGDPGCAPNGECIGTGTLLTHEGQLFLLTCHHVADDFYKAQDGIIAVGEGRPAPTIARNATRLWRRDKEDDLALITLEEDLPTTLKPRTLEEFRIEPDFRKIQAQKRGFALVGFPAEKVDLLGKKKRAVRGLTYGAVGHPTKKATKRSLFLAYKSGTNDPALPHPRGLSGAAVVAFDLPKKGTVWGYGKVIALQSASPKDTHSYLRATTLRKLNDWL